MAIGDKFAIENYVFIIFDPLLSIARAFCNASYPFLITKSVFICTICIRVQIVHMNTALDNIFLLTNSAVSESPFASTVAAAVVGHVATVVHGRGREGQGEGHKDTDSGECGGFHF